MMGGVAGSEWRRATMGEGQGARSEDEEWGARYGERGAKGEGREARGEGLPDGSDIMASFLKGCSAPCLYKSLAPKRQEPFNITR